MRSRRTQILAAPPAAHTSGFCSSTALSQSGQACHSPPGAGGREARQQQFLFSLDKSFIHKGVDLTSLSRFLSLLEFQWERETECHAQTSLNS